MAAAVAMGLSLSAAPSSAASVDASEDAPVVYHDDGDVTFHSVEGAHNVTVNEDDRVVTVTSPDGTTETFGSDSGLWEHASDQAVDMPLSGSADGTEMSPNIIPNPLSACQAIVVWLGAAHTTTWLHILALAAVNPPVAAIVALGQAFFWAWVANNC